MLSLNKHLSNLFDKSVLIRGKNYFLSNLVKNLEIKENIVKAIVHGSRKYKVKIEFKDKYEPVKMFCSCPYFERDNCKHLAAFFFELEKVGYLNLNGKEVNIIPLTEEKVKVKKQNSDSGKIIKTGVENKLKNDIGELKKKIDFSLFEDRIQPLIPQKRANNKRNYKIGFAIQSKHNATSLHIVKQRLLKDGTVAEISKVSMVNYEQFLPLTLEERLVVNLLMNKYFDLKIYLGGEVKFRSDINLRQGLDDILNILTGKDIYIQNGYSSYTKIEIVDEKGYCKLFVNDNEGNINLKLGFYLGNNKIPTGTAVIPILDQPVWVLAENKIFRLTNIEYNQFNAFVEAGSNFTIPKVYLEYFKDNVLPQITTNLPIESEKYFIETIETVPTKKIYLEENNSILLINLKFGYNDYIVSYDENEFLTPLAVDNKIIHIIRNKELEFAARNEVKNSYVKELQPGLYMPRNSPVDFLLKYLTHFIELGFEILGTDNLKKFKINTSFPNFKYHISSGLDWFDLEMKLDFSGTAVTLDSLLDSLKNKKNYVKLSDGSIGVLPEEWIEKFKKFLIFGELNANKIRFSKVQITVLDAILSDSDNINADDQFSEYANKLKSFAGIKKRSIPKFFKGDLREYQKAGFNWFYFLKEYSFGGILADDMGLGKTIQVLALLAKEKKKKYPNTSLVIAPTSVVFNWINEAKNFVPELKIINHTGNERFLENKEYFDEYDVVLTSYSILLRDYKLFINKNFHYVILDESQKIKNPISKTSRLVRELKSSYRLCVTGTPVENNINELWSQMSFLNPGFFGSLNKFQETFTKPIQKENDIAAADFLKKSIYPFILRRTKEIVEKDLPPKTETIYYCNMTEEQENFYKLWKDAIRFEVIKEIEEKGIKKSGFKVLEGLLRLRQICNHPALVDNKYKRKSGKFEEFKDMIMQVVEEGHKILVFSQFVKMLDIMATYLKNQKINYEYLTGSTREREKCVDNFKNDTNIKVFLISLKAGGFGLNLTAADYVFHYDPWWNPAVEAQATDRTHRIGQTKNIFSYKFITKKSVEEKILHLQSKKRKLVENIISTESGILKNLSKEDIDLLFE